MAGSRITGRPAGLDFHFYVAHPLGTADPDYYGIRRRPRPRTWEQQEGQTLDCVAAISATLLQDVYVPPHSYEWLRELGPIDRIGYSIYVYDLRRDGRSDAVTAHK